MDLKNQHDTILKNLKLYDKNLKNDILKIQNENFFQKLEFLYNCLSKCESKFLLKLYMMEIISKWQEIFQSNETFYDYTSKQLRGEFMNYCYHYSSFSKYFTKSCEMFGFEISETKIMTSRFIINLFNSNISEKSKNYILNLINFNGNMNISDYYDEDILEGFFFKKPIKDEEISNIKFNIVCFFMLHEDSYFKAMIYLYKLKPRYFEYYLNYLILKKIYIKEDLKNDKKIFNSNYDVENNFDIFLNIYESIKNFYISIDKKYYIRDVFYKFMYIEKVYTNKNKFFIKYSL